MVDVLLQIGAAKLVVSVLLAGLAWLVHRRVGYPAVAHSLWLLVLVVLLLPAVVALPVLPAGGSAAAEIADDAGVAGAARVEVGSVGPARPEDVGRGTSSSAGITGNGKAGVAFVWLVVGAVILGWTLVRALRFRRRLVRSSGPAPPKLRQEVVELGRRLHLMRIPAVHTTSARVSPMVFWAGGTTHLVVPTFLLASLDRQERRAVLAHELAHVRRRDHFVRWIEWLACSAFWWNPVTWWARRELRAAEEAACDALGATAAESTPRAYATSLLRVVELLSKPPMPPTPAFASGVASGRNRKALERRFRMLISGKSNVQTPRWMHSVGVASAVALLPLGLVYCGFADQADPTALEEPPEIAASAPDRETQETEEGLSEAAEWKLMVDAMRNRSGPTYWILGSTNSRGPYSLVDASGLPVQCQLDRDERYAEAGNNIKPACLSALAAHVRGQEDPAVWGVCVGQGRVGGGWSGQCNTWHLPHTWQLPPRIPNERTPALEARLRVNETGSALLEFTPPRQVPEGSVDSTELTAGDVARFMKMVVGQAPTPQSVTQGLWDR